MYVLINQCGEQFSVEAISPDKKALRRHLVKKARKYVKDYFFDSSYDDFAIAKGKRLLEGLKNFKADYWDDEDDSYLMAWKIENIPCLKTKHKPVTCVMAFGTEVVKGLENAEKRLAVIKEYKDTDMLIVNRFKTKAEKQAYLRGINHAYGYEAYQEYPELTKTLLK